MRCSESVVNIAVGIRCQCLYELLLRSLYSVFSCLLLLIGSILSKSARFSLFLCIETKVLEKENFARLKSRCLSLSLLAILGKLNGNSEKLAYVCQYVLEREFRVYLLRTSEVRHNDQCTTTSEHLLKSRKSCTDTCIICNFEILVKWNVEIHTNNGFFAFEIVRIDKLLHNFIFDIYDFRVAKLHKKT